MPASFNDITVPTSGQGDANQTTGAATDSNNPTVVDVTGTKPPPDATSSQPSTGSGVDWSKLISAGIPLVSNYLTNQNAAQNSADQVKLIQGMMDKYGTLANPYGAYRDAAAQKLAALQADPSSIANTPGYKFSLQQGLGAVANRDNSRFGVGAGSTNPDLMNFAQGLASKTYNDTINQYQAQAGVGMSTGPAAGIYGQGISGIAQNTAAGNAASGANTNLVGSTVGKAFDAIGGLAGLAKIFQNSGMSPAQAVQMAHQVMGTPTTTSTPGDGTTANAGGAAATPGGGLNPTNPDGTLSGGTSPPPGMIDDGSGNLIPDPNYTPPDLSSSDFGNLGGP